MPCVHTIELKLAHDKHHFNVTRSIISGSEFFLTRQEYYICNHGEYEWGFTALSVEYDGLFHSSVYSSVAERVQLWTSKG